MKEIDFSKIAVPDAYRFLVSAVVPRPIAWVSSVSRDGKTNLAPFSFFNAVCSNPPTLLFCPVNHPDGREKDTLRNIRETGEFAVNIVSRALAEKMNQTSGNYPSSVSEFEVVGLTAAPSKKIKAPRVAESSIQIECRLNQIVSIGDGSAGSGHIVIGQILFAHVNEALYTADRIDVLKLHPIARLGGSDYSEVEKTFALERPKV